MNGSAVRLPAVLIGLVGIVGITTLVGCAQPQTRDALPMQSPPPFTAGGEAPLRNRWWTAFDDGALNRQIDAALSQNFSLTVAWERLRAAEAVAEREASDLWPDLDGTADVSRDQRFEIAEGGDGNGDGQTQLSLGLTASYEVDLWDRIQSRVDAERLRASATRAEYQTAALTLTAEVARTWYELGEAQSQLRLIADQVQTNETVLNLLRERFAAGLIRSADVQRQRQLVEATREQAIQVRARAAVLRHRLAVLKGRPPQSAPEKTDATLTELPPLPDTGLPGALVQRRPDVRRAYRSLRAADLDLASAVSDQYPRINLTASLSTSAESPENLFRDWLASLAGGLVAPLFDAGQRRSEVQRTAAVTRQRLAEYGQTVLDAFAEVEDALSQERRQLERIESLRTQLDLADRVYAELRVQYLNGVADYLDVLDALTEQQRLERELLTARLSALQFRVALYRALAGAFRTPREADVEAATQPKEDADDG